MSTVSGAASRDDKYGFVAEFETQNALLHAAEKLRDAGYTRFDAHSPFPIHGMDKAMGLGQSKLPILVFLGGLFGCSGALALQYWVHVIENPLNIAGKPFFSLPAFIIVMFEMTILFAAFTTVFGMFGLNKLPMYFHGVFNHPRFHKVTDDAFFVSVEAADPRFDENKTRILLMDTGAKNIELVNG